MPTDPVADASPVAVCGIAVMAKVSKPGRTKTRLSPPLSAEEAARFNTAFLRDIADNLIVADRLAAGAPSIAGYMAYGPPGEGGFFDFLPSSIGLFEAWRPAFGDTLDGTIAHLLDRGHACALAINADSPTLPPSLLVEAARALGAPGDRVVLGPSTDGGYYLIGLKRLHRRLFEDIAWSTDRVAEQTLARAAEIGLAVHVLPPWYDVDDEESLATLRRELFDGVPFGDGTRLVATAKHTRALLASLAAGPAT